MANYNNYKDAQSLANAYGYDMKLYGKSLYWSSPRKCEDTTADLKSSETFKNLSRGEQQQILDYGHLCYRFGMGCYQERGANVELYDRYVFSDGPPNPFAKKKNESSSESQPGEY